MGTSIGRSGSKTVNDKAYYEGLGLVADHSYSILDVREVQGHR